MNKIGIIFAGYNTEEYIDESIKPWIEARANKLMGYEFVICAVSVPFLEYKDEPFKDGTTEALKDYYKNFKIDHLITEPIHIREHEARDLALQYLLKQNVDIVVLWDSDECATQEQIEEILIKVELDKWTSWFSIQYRNFAFDKNTYLAEPFTPPRIFRVKTSSCKLLAFAWDNDPTYQTENGKGISYKELPTKLIRNSPINHYSWIGETAKRKIEYQKNHFGGSCSYRWDDINGLSFNEEYYKKLGQKVPEVMKIID